MADLEHVALLKQGSDAINKWTKENPGVHLDLAGADLAGMDLQGCNLSEANLAGANLARADLRTTNLGGADLKGANLQGTDARNAALHRAKLQGADLRGANLETIGVGRQLICASVNTFGDARWDRERIEEILALLNLNRDWEIRYEIVARTR